MATNPLQNDLAAAQKLAKDYFAGEVATHKKFVASLCAAYGFALKGDKNRQDFEALCKQKTIPYNNNEPNYVFPATIKLLFFPRTFKTNVHRISKWANVIGYAHKCKVKEKDFDDWYKGIGSVEKILIHQRAKHNKGSPIITTTNKLVAAKTFLDQQPKTDSFQVDTDVLAEIQNDNDYTVSVCELDKGNGVASVKHVFTNTGKIDAVLKMIQPEIIDDELYATIDIIMKMTGGCDIKLDNDTVSNISDEKYSILITASCKHSHNDKICIRTHARKYLKTLAKQNPKFTAVDDDVAYLPLVPKINYTSAPIHIALGEVAKMGSGDTKGSFRIVDNKLFYNSATNKKPIRIGDAPEIESSESVAVFHNDILKIAQNITGKMTLELGDKAIRILAGNYEFLISVVTNVVLANGKDSRRIEFLQM